MNTNLAANSRSYPSSNKFWLSPWPTLPASVVKLLVVKLSALADFLPRNQFKTGRQALSHLWDCGTIKQCTLIRAVTGCMLDAIETVRLSKTKIRGRAWSLGLLFEKISEILKGVCSAVQTTACPIVAVDMGSGDDFVRIDPFSLASVAVFSLDGGLDVDTLDRGGLAVGLAVNFEILI